MAGGLAKTLGDAVSRMLKRFTRSAEKATEDPSGPTQEAADEADRAFRDNAGEGKAFAERASTEARNRAAKGWEINRLERWSMDQLRKLIDLAEKWRKRITKALTPAKAALVAGTTVLVASAAATLQYAAPPRQAAPYHEPAPIGTGYPVHIDIPPPIPDIPSIPADLMLGDDAFRLALARLDIPSLQLSDFGRERLDLPTDFPPPIAVPVAVAAASAAPVEVTASYGEVTRSGTTTVGELYEAMPEAREEIADQVSESGGSGLHVDIDVGTDFASIRIKS